MPAEPNATPGPSAGSASAPAAAAPAPAPAPAPAAPDTPGDSGISKLVKVTLVVLLVMFIYHVIADRGTPYSAQATVDTFLVSIAPQVSGPVAVVAVGDNQQVRRGQMLFQIEPEPFQIALSAAQANLALAIQNAESAEADVLVADATLRKQRVDQATSQQLGKIVLDLTAKRALSETAAIRARSDMSKSAADTVKAEAEAERARVRQGEVGPGNAQVRQARAALDQARLDLQHTTVRAPADGVVTNLRLAPGQFTSSGQPVLSFIANGPRWVTAMMRENQLGNIAPGNRAYVVFDDQPGRVLEARVESVGWGVSQGSESPTGQLATVEAPSGWLREPQRFPVRIVVQVPADEADKQAPGRSGAQANAIVLTQDTSLLNPIARLWIWIVAKMSYLR